MKRVSVILVVCAVLTVIAVVSCESKPTITVTNLTGQAISDMIISAESNDSDWEEADLFGGKTLKNGESIEINKTEFTKSENYDLSFAGEDGTDYFIWSVNPEWTDSLTVEPDDTE